MTECCGPPVGTDTTRTCPRCAGKTLAVDLATVKALLTPAALARLEMVTFRFCTDPACDLVYVSDTGQAFGATDLRVPVWQKEPPGGRLLCYCFGENEGDLRREIESRGSTDVLSRVRAHIAERRCACEVRNPRGACCLGDLTAAVERLEQEAKT